MVRVEAVERGRVIEGLFQEPDGDGVESTEYADVGVEIVMWFEFAAVFLDEEFQSSLYG